MTKKKPKNPSKRPRGRPIISSDGVRKKSYATKLPVEVIDYFRSLENAAAEIEKVILKSKQFQSWKEKRIDEKEKKR